jgi:hypothetical protein
MPAYGGSARAGAILPFLSAPVYGLLSLAIDVDASEKVFGELGSIGVPRAGRPADAQPIAIGAERAATIRRAALRTSSGSTISEGV